MKLHPMEHADFVFTLVSNRANAAHFQTREKAQGFADGIRESTVWSADDRGSAWVVRVGPWMYARDIVPRVAAKPPVKGVRAYTRLTLTHEQTARLGKETDLVIADELGCSRNAVTYVRRKLGIPATYEFHGALQWTADMDKLVGLDFDYKIAARLHVSTDAVRKRRDQLGLPAVGPSKNKAA